MTRGRVLGAALAAALTLAAPARADAGCPGADRVVDAQNADALIAPTMCLLNAQRRAAGLRPVSGQPKLTVAASRFAAQMVGMGFFAHRAPGGPDLVGRLRQARYLGLRTTTPWIVGENLAWARGSAATPRDIVAEWMASPGHQRNILEPSYRDVGIGVAGGSPGDPGEGVTVTTDFGMRWLGGDRRRRVRSADATAVAGDSSG
jgi:uncharacterized protein YkwD